jgi:hypothetical protein
LNEYKSLGFLDGYSGDLIRPSLCSFIENISQSIGYFQENQNENYFSKETIDCWQTILDECISNLDDDVRQAGLNALKAFSHAFYSQNRYVSIIDSNRKYFLFQFIGFNRSLSWKNLHDISRTYSSRFCISTCISSIFNVINQ